MKKLITALFCFGVLFLSLSTSHSQVVMAANAKSDKLQLSSENYDDIIQKNHILSAVSSDESDSANTLKTLFSGKIITITNIIIGAVALIWMVILGIKFIFSQGNDDEQSKYKEQFGYIVAGLLLVSLAEYAGFQVFDPTQDLVNDQTSSDNFYAKIMQVKLFFQYIVGGIALANGVRSGYSLITAADGGEDEAIQKEKEFVASIAFGTVLILLSEVLITGILFVNGETANATQGIIEIGGMINFVLSFAAGAAAFMLVLASLYYVTSLGDEDRANRAKQIIISCVTALIILFSAYTIVRFLF